MENKRIEWLDVGKGIGILLVIVGHAFTAVIRNSSQIAMMCYDFIYFMHMPFLFCLSGYSFRLAEKRYLEMSMKTFVLKKGKILLVPYLVYSFICYVIFRISSMIPGIGPSIKNAGYGEMPLLEWIKGLIIGDNFYSSHLWYVYVLFFFFILTYLLKKICKGNYLILCIAIAFLVILKGVYIEGVVFALPNFLFLYIWFVIGNIISMDKINAKNAIGSFVIAMLFWVMQYITPILQGDSWILYFVMIAMKGFAVIALIGFSKWVSAIGSKSLKYLGQRSFVIYLFHQPFFGSVYGSLLFGFFRVPILFVLITSIGLSLLVPLCISKLLGKTKHIKYLFGISR